MVMLRSLESCDIDAVHVLISRIEKKGDGRDRPTS